MTSTPFYAGLAASELRVAETGYRAAVAYDSRFGNWEARASVRRKPARRLEGQGDELAVPFPPELAPVATHPLVTGRGPAAVREVLTHCLYQYLHFTTELEELAVIPVVGKISRNRAGLLLPEAMRADAFKIYTDEAWHAQFSYDLVRQVERGSGIAVRLPELPLFVDRLDAVRDRLDPAVRGLEGLMFSIVSETLISAILADLPHDARLPKAVRELVRDHAEDEGRHHAYFRQLLDAFWPALSARERAAVGPLLPEIVYAFLEPDYRAAGLALRAVGLRPDEVAQVLAESLPRDRVTGDVAAAARSAVRYFCEVGALDNPATAEAFEASGLLARVP
ncbi:diiron oxygenase [Streptomyces sp. NPDC093510]|uniref:diiron oxygenase n=1 Tax=Streptomyces sp. NPDC093510 TaxID=3155199 RepID=UPI00341A50D4